MKHKLDIKLSNEKGNDTKIISLREWYRLEKKDVDFKFETTTGETFWFIKWNDQCSFAISKNGRMKLEIYGNQGYEETTKDYYNEDEFIAIYEFLTKNLTIKE